MFRIFPSIKYFNINEISDNIKSWAGRKCSDLKRKAKKKQLPFNLNSKDILEIIPNNFICPILNIQMELYSKDIMMSPSVDRIISQNGYVKNNIQIISNKANSIKNNATLEELKQIREYMKKYSSTK